MKQTLKRLVALLLSIVLVLGMFPGVTWAVEEQIVVKNQAEVIPISNEAELRAVKDNLAGSYKLTKEIVLTGGEWIPIGNEKEPFTGTFDGDGYIISGLNITAGASTYQGMFATVGKDGVVENLTVGGTISSTSGTNARIGGVAGRVQDGKITNCISKVSINAPKAKTIGGIAGDSLGETKITGCANLGDINASFAVGGITGNAAGTTEITNCYNTGTLTTGSNNCGGLVGSATGTVKIQNCYNVDKGLREGKTNSGVLIGLLNSTSTAKNCYWLENGSLPGIGNGTVGTIENCFVKTESEMKASAFLELINEDAPIDSLFVADSGNINKGYPVLAAQLPKVKKYQVKFDLTPTNALLTVKDGNGVSQIGTKGIYHLPLGDYTYSASAFGYQSVKEVSFSVRDKEEAEIIKVVLEEGALQTVHFAGIPQGAILTVHNSIAGEITPESEGSYRLPVGEYTYTVIAKGYAPLVNQQFTVADGPVNNTISMTSLGSPEPWDGEAKTPITPNGGIYYIQNGAELAWLASQINTKNLLDARVVLLNDINLNSKPWISMGSYDRIFQGSFDGNNCSINGLAGDCYGLFYGIGKDGILENLTVVGSITGSSNTGGIVGVNSGTVRNCAASVSVAANGQRVGGVVGNNSGGLISCCASLASVSSSYTSYGQTVNLGGIAGQNSGRIENSYSTAKVTATGQNHNGCVGGITGFNTGSIKNTYNAGMISYSNLSDKATGAIVGDLSTGSVTNSYYLEGSCTKGVGMGSPDGIESKSDAEMKKYTLAVALNDGRVEGTFYLADDEGQNSGYPVLKWQGGKAPVANPEEVAVATDKTNLRLPQLVYTYATTINLPKTGGLGSTISWESNRPDVISEKGVVLQPIEESKATVILTATLSKGSVQDTKSFTLTVYSKDQVSRNYLEEAKRSLGTVLRPVYGRDTNIVEHVQHLLADRGFGDVNVSLKNPGAPSMGKEAYIAEDGKLTYFYRDPVATSGMNVGIMRNLSFSLSMEGQSVDLDDVQANIPWDQAKVLKLLEKEVASKLTWDTIKGKNISQSEVTLPLMLPLKLADASWARISWETDSWAIDPEIASDPSALSTTGFINRQSVDAQVNLTANITFNLTESNETAINFSVPFDLTVSGSEGVDTPEKMQKKLESYTMERLTDSIRKVQLDPNAVTGDIQFPTPSKTGVPDYSAYRFTISSKDTSVLEINGYRGYIYRPLPGKEPVTTTFTVTMTSRANPALSASKSMSITVLPLEQNEIDEAIRLMEAVRSDYANALLGVNKGKDQIIDNLSAFREAIFGSDGKSLVYSRKLSDDTGLGVVVDDLPGSGPDQPGYEQWRVFRSSRPDILTHELLRLTKPLYDTTVTVDSCLTHDVLGKYARKYPGNKEFAALYQVSIVAPFTVKGISDGPNPNPDRTFTATFSLDGRGYIDSIHGVSIDGLKSGTTVFDVLKQVLNNNGFTYHAKGSYVSSVTDAKGKCLTEFDQGEGSGWMYKVNGTFPDKMMNGYYLSGGEVIEFVYTADWKKEPGVKGGMGTLPVNEDVLNPMATVDKNGEAKVQIDTKSMESIVASAKTKGISNIIIEPAVKGDEVSKMTVSLPKEAVNLIAREASMKLTVKTVIGEVSLPNAALSELAKKSSGNVTISVGLVKSTESKKTGEIKVEVKVDGNAIESLKGGILVKLKADKTNSGTVLVIITDKGTKTVRKSFVNGNQICAWVDGTATVSIRDNAKTFTDIADGYWGKDAVNFATSHELFQGTEADVFNPTGTMTRSMLVTVLHRLENEVTPTKNTFFADVDKSAWYSNASDWAAASGIVNGTGAGFDPNGSISREQLAAMLYRYAGSIGGVTSVKGDAIKKFGDGDSVSPWATDAMAWAVNSGLISGRENNTLAPADTATRTEVAVILQRFVSTILK